MSEVIDRRSDSEKADQRDLMERALDWPRYPVLPLKRTVKKGRWTDQEFGCLIFFSPPEIDVNSWVYRITMPELSRRVREGRVGRDELPKLEYRSFVDLVDDGWEID